MKQDKKAKDNKDLKAKNTHREEIAELAEKASTADTIDSLMEFFYLSESDSKEIKYNNLLFVKSSSERPSEKDLWKVYKIFDCEWLEFECLSMLQSIINGKFKELIGRLQSATKEQCEQLTY